MMIAENTTHFPGAREMFDYGRSFKDRWIDVVDPDRNKDDPEEQKKKEFEEDTRSSKEFADDLWQRIRKKKKRR